MTPKGRTEKLVDEMQHLTEQEKRRMFQSAKSGAFIQPPDGLAAKLIELVEGELARHPDSETLTAIKKALRAGNRIAVHAVDQARMAGTPLNEIPALFSIEEMQFALWPASKPKEPALEELAACSFSRGLAARFLNGKIEKHLVGTPQHTALIELRSKMSDTRHPEYISTIAGILQEMKAAGLQIEQEAAPIPGMRG